MTNQDDGIAWGAIDLGDGRSKQYRVVEEGQELQVVVRFVRDGEIEDVQMKVLSIPAGFEAYRDGEDVVVRVFGRTGLFPSRLHRF